MRKMNLQYYFEKFVVDSSIGTKIQPVSAIYLYNFILNRQYSSIRIRENTFLSPLIKLRWMGIAMILQAIIQMMHSICRTKKQNKTTKVQNATFLQDKKEVPAWLWCKRLWAIASLAFIALPDLNPISGTISSSTRLITNSGSISSFIISHILCKTQHAPSTTGKSWSLTSVRFCKQDHRPFNLANAPLETLWISPIFSLKACWVQVKCCCV